MFGLQFLAPLFVAAGAIGAAIPLILHLLNRERARRLIFSTVRFIAMSHQTNVQRHKLKRMLLLLMRILMLALLGLAFARPFFADEAPRLTPQTGGKRNIVIILDTSYSMQYQDVFDNAKKAAVKQIVEHLDRQDAACLILSSDKARVVAPLGSELAHIKDATNRAEATYAPTDYLDALQTADEMLQRQHSGQKQIYLIADLQKRGWENFIDTDKLSSNVKIEFVDVGAKQPRNLAITAVRVPPVILNNQKAAQLVARIHNFGDEPASSVPVRLFIDGNVISTVQLDVEANDIADAVFKVDFQNEAKHTGWVELPDDALAVDNRRYFMLQSRASIKVHCVNSEPSTRAVDVGGWERDLLPHERETFFLKRAIEAGREVDLGGWEIDFTQSVALPDAALLARDDVLILANVGGLTSAEAQRLKAYVGGGGGLIVTVGDNVESDVYQQRLGGETPLMPCSFIQPIGDALDREQFRVLASVNYEHPIFAPFKEPNHGDFGKARFYRHFQAVPAAEATVIAAYDNGEPALFEKSYGTGRVLCFTSTIDRAWNDLPIRAVYLPFLHECIKYLTLKRVDAVPDYRVGDSIELSGFEEIRRKEVVIFNPRNAETRLRHNEAVETASHPPKSTDNAYQQGSVFYEDTTLPGIYSVHTAGAEPRYFVVNVDTTESNLAARDVEELTSMLMGSTEKSLENKPTETELKAAYHEDVEKNQDVWAYLMLAVFALGVTEMFFANRI